MLSRRGRRKKGGEGKRDEVNEGRVSRCSKRIKGKEKEKEKAALKILEAERIKIQEEEMRILRGEQEIDEAALDAQMLDDFAYGERPTSASRRGGRQDYRNQLEDEDELSGDEAEMLIDEDDEDSEEAHIEDDEDSEDNDF